MTKRNMKGVQDIKTLSGRVDKESIPYKAYMKLSILEMEKFRRGKEKQSALERVLNIDQRFKDIEMESRELIAALEQQGKRRHRLPAPEEQPPAPETSRTATTAAGAFKIKY